MRRRKIVSGQAFPLETDSKLITEQTRLFNSVCSRRVRPRDQRDGLAVKRDDPTTQVIYRLFPKSPGFPAFHKVLEGYSEQNQSLRNSNA